MKDVFQERFEELIRQKNIKITDLSKELGISRKSIYKFMNGSTYPSTDTITKIANFLDVSIDYLLGRVNEPTGFVLMDEDEKLKEQIHYINKSYRRMNETERRIIYNLVKSIDDEKKKEKDTKGDLR